MRHAAIACYTARRSVDLITLRTSRRTLINGVVSSRIPSGMTLLDVRYSEDVVEQLATAYVDMDMATMTAFHKKAMQEMLRGGSSSRGGPSGSPPVEVNYEEQLLQAMGSGGGVGSVTVPSGPVAATTPSDTNGGAAAGTEAASAKKAPEKMAFDITLKAFPAENKIKLIKELRAVCGLGIQEAKAAIEKSPGVVARQVQKADAEKLKDAMVKLGAEVVLA